MLPVIAEFLGTFLFLSVINLSGDPIAIAAALLAVIYAFGKISGGHFNPAVTAMMLAKGAIDPEKCITYVLAQVVGGVTALYWSSMQKA